MKKLNLAAIEKKFNLLHDLDSSQIIGGNGTTTTTDGEYYTGPSTPLPEVVVSAVRNSTRNAVNFFSGAGIGFAQKLDGDYYVGSQKVLDPVTVTGSYGGSGGNIVDSYVNYFRSLGYQFSGGNGNGYVVTAAPTSKGALATGLYWKIN